MGGPHYISIPSVPPAFHREAGMQFEERRRSDHAIFLARSRYARLKALSLDLFKCALQSGPDLKSRTCTEYPQ
jgi:hypothetical protein